MKTLSLLAASALLFITVSASANNKRDTIANVDSVKVTEVARNFSTGLADVAQGDAEITSGNEPVPANIEPTATDKEHAFTFMMPEFVWGNASEEVIICDEEIMIRLPEFVWGDPADDIGLK